MLFIVRQHLFAQLVLGTMASVLFCDVGLPNIDNIDDFEKTPFSITNQTGTVSGTTLLLEQQLHGAS